MLLEKYVCHFLNCIQTARFTIILRNIKEWNCFLFRAHCQSVLENPLQYFHCWQRESEDLPVEHVSFYNATFSPLSLLLSSFIYRTLCSTSLFGQTMKGCHGELLRDPRLGEAGMTKITNKESDWFKYICNKKRQVALKKEKRCLSLKHSSSAVHIKSKTKWCIS